MSWKARYGLSTQLIVGIERLSRSVIEGNDFDDFFTIHQKNLTSILFSVNCIEAKINELVAVFGIDNRTSIHDKIQVIFDIEKKISLIEKYNLVCSYLNEELWDASNEPFQSFEIIQILRNEIVHYKGKFEKKGIYPKKLNNLFKKIKCVVTKDDIWLKCILENKNLSPWILEITKRMDKIIDEKISKNLA
jgi:hypothetical protein